jgi:glutamate 5-kinase
MASMTLTSNTSASNTSASVNFTSHLPQIDQFHRIVIKVGSSLLVDRHRGRLKYAWLASLVEDIAELHQRGAEVLVVSSGSIALGRTVLGLPSGSLKLEESQAAAAVGQIALARSWAEALSAHGLTAGQVLLTLSDTEERRRYLNARATLGKLMEMRAIPVINENDTVATSEIRYGDNDRLAARVATMAGADLVILFSDIDGLYTAPPATNPDAKHLAVIDHITPEIEAMAGGAASELSRGGMNTKIEAAKIATSGGAHLLITKGEAKNPLQALKNGAKCTWFLTSSNPITSRKTWIAGSLEPKGTVYVDAGAKKALLAGASLLPVGVTKVEGDFARGDAVMVRGPKGEELGRGLVAYDAEDAVQILGKASGKIEEILGHAGRAEMIHRDDLVLRAGVGGA